MATAASAGQRLERAARRRRLEHAALAAVEVQHADALLAAVRPRPARRTAPARAARTARAGCRAPPSPCGPAPASASSEVGDDARLARREDLVGDLAGLVSNVRPGSVTRPRPRPILKSRVPSAPASMMNPRSAAGHLDGRVDHHRQHVVEHAARAQRAAGSRAARDLPEVAGRVASERVLESRAGRR